MTEIDPSARVQFRGVGQLQHPGNCAMCGNGTCEKGYVDPSIWYEWEGQVYFCFNCTVQMAEAIGCLAPDQSEFLVNQNKELAAKLQSATEELDNANTNLSIFYGAINAAAVDALVSNSSDEPTVESAPEPTSEPVTVGTEQEPVASKSVKKRRPNDAPRITGSDGSDAFLL